MRILARFTICMTKYRYWYRQQFEKLFPQEACTESVVRWIPRADWGCPSDPSGRAQKVHSAAYMPEKPGAPARINAQGIVEKQETSSMVA